MTTDFPSVAREFRRLSELLGNMGDELPPVEVRLRIQLDVLLLKKRWAEASAVAYVDLETAPERRVMLTEDAPIEYIREVLDFVSDGVARLP